MELFRSSPLAVAVVLVIATASRAAEQCPLPHAGSSAALDLDGTTCVLLPSNNPVWLPGEVNPSLFSVEGWFRPTAAVDSTIVDMAFNVPGALRDTGLRIGLLNDAGTLKLTFEVVDGGGGHGQVTVNNAVVLNDWYYFSMVFDGTNDPYVHMAYLYLFDSGGFLAGDNQGNCEQASLRFDPTKDTTVAIGCLLQGNNQNSPSMHFRGQLSNIRFISGVNSPAFIAQRTKTFAVAGTTHQWPLDGNLNDIVGDKHGSAIGAPTLPFVCSVAPRCPVPDSNFVHALSFDGNMCVELPRLDGPSGLWGPGAPSAQPAAFSIEGWMRAHTDHLGVLMAVGYEYSTAGFRMTVQPGRKLQLDFIEGGSTGEFVTADSTFQLGNWYYVAFIFDGSGGSYQARFYVFDEQRQLVDNNYGLCTGDSIDYTAASFPFATFGCERNATHPIINPFQGELSNWRHYAGSYTGGDLAARMKAAAPAGLQQQWSFDGTVADSVGSINGALIGTETYVCEPPAPPAYLYQGQLPDPQPLIELDDAASAIRFGPTGDVVFRAEEGILATNSELVINDTKVLAMLRNLQARVEQLEA